MLGDDLRREMGLEPMLAEGRVAELERQVTDLQEANNRYLKRARDAEAALGLTATHRHVKRGSEVVVLGDGRVQTDTPLVDMDEVVIYRHVADGALWVRPSKEFHDGRFELIGKVSA